VDCEFAVLADYDSTRAAQTRRTVFDRLCEAPTILCAHFPTSSTGRVRR
jgi:hypothetical protein